MAKLIRFFMISMILIMAFVPTFVSAESNPVQIKLNGSDIVSDTEPVIVEGRTLVPARAIFEAMGGSVNWDNQKRQVTVVVDDTEVILTIDLKIALVNGEEQTIDVPATIINDRTLVPLRFISESVGCTVSWDNVNRIVSIAYKNLPELNPAASEKLVFLDAGHGGRDTGAIGYLDVTTPVYEKVINLRVANKLNDLLTKSGVNVYNLRSTDTTIGLYNRQDKANELGASLYVAIHNNSAPSSVAHGTEVLYGGDDYPEVDGISASRFAKLVQKEMVESLGTSGRKARTSPGLAVIRRTTMPAVVIEGAFMSNPEDLKLMITDSFVDHYALAVAKSILITLNESVEDETPEENPDQTI